VAYEKKGIMKRSRANSLMKPRRLPYFSLHKNHLPKVFCHSKVSVFVAQKGVAGALPANDFLCMALQFNTRFSIHFC